MFSPFVGRIIDNGLGNIVLPGSFWLPLLLLLVATQALLLSAAFAATTTALIGVLLLNTLCNALAFTTQFAYVAMTFDAALFGPLIACCNMLQGVLGLLAWPGLCPNPFGVTAFKPVLLGVLMPPTVLLLMCPLYERSLERLLRYGGDGVTANATAALAKRHMWTFFLPTEPSPPTHPTAAECETEDSRAVGVKRIMDDESAGTALLHGIGATDGHEACGGSCGRSHSNARSERRAECASWSHPSAHDWRSDDGAYASRADSNTASAPSSRRSSFSAVPVPYPYAW